MHYIILLNFIRSESALEAIVVTMVASDSLESFVGFPSRAVATDRPSGRQNGPWKRMCDDNH